MDCEGCVTWPYPITLSCHSHCTHSTPAILVPHCPSNTPSAVCLRVFAPTVSSAWTTVPQILAWLASSFPIDFSLKGHLIHQRVPSPSHVQQQSPPHTTPIMIHLPVFAPIAIIIINVLDKNVKCWAFATLFLCVWISSNRIFENKMLSLYGLCPESS